MRSYQWDCVYVAAAEAEYWRVSAAGVNAFGANSAPGVPCRDGGRGVDGASWGDGWKGGWGVEGRWIFAVGGGAIPVRGPEGGPGFCEPLGVRCCEGEDGEDGACFGFGE